MAALDLRQKVETRELGHVNLAGGEARNVVFLAFYENDNPLEITATFAHAQVPSISISLFPWKKERIFASMPRC